MKVVDRVTAIKHGLTLVGKNPHGSTGVESRECEACFDPHVG